MDCLPDGVTPIGVSTACLLSTHAFIVTLHDVLVHPISLPLPLFTSCVAAWSSGHSEFSIAAPALLFERAKGAKFKETFSLSHRLFDIRLPPDR